MQLCTRPALCSSQTLPSLSHPQAPSNPPSLLACIGRCTALAGRAAARAVLGGTRGVAGAARLLQPPAHPALLRAAQLRQLAGAPQGLPGAAAQAAWLGGAGGRKARSSAAPGQSTPKRERAAVHSVSQSLCLKTWAAGLHRPTPSAAASLAAGLPFKAASEQGGVRGGSDGGGPPARVHLLPGASAAGAAEKLLADSGRAGRRLCQLLTARQTCAAP